ncbi:MAG: SusC/RagA family TonB-linked outer membrane protein [Bacteroidales bacterium]|nr:SusC/RagA family TonB-linked outer membrane protein [Bacteroidales bacterium]
MKKTITAILLALILFNAGDAFSQQNRIIRGRITDSGDKTAVIGANIIEYDDENRIINGTISDVNGDFVLEMKNIDHTLKVSVIGYDTREITPDPTKVLSIELNPTNVELEEVTITAKSQSRFSLTNIDERDNASSTVKIDLIDMQNSGVLSATDALQGKVSGLDIIASGDPGSGSQLVIRGLSSMGNSQPLIVVDGVPQFRVNRDNIDLSSADTEDLSNLVNIAVQDIKSIEILKDAASTAVWGADGADGVLLIETHAGRLGKVQFDYQYKPSLNIQPPAIPMLNGDEYIMLQLEEWHNAYGVFDIPPEIAYDRDYYDFYNYSANTDWLDEITQNAFTHDHYFKIAGGGQKTRYFTSFSYIDEGGTTINTDSKRISTRVNLDYYLSRKLIFMIQFNYTNNNTNGHVNINNRNVRSMAMIKAPNMSIWEYDAYGNPTGEYFTPINSYQGNGSDYFNPVAVANLDKNHRHENYLQNTFRLRYNLTDWLTINETVSFQYKGYKTQNYLPYNALGTDWLAWTVNKAEESNNIESGIRTETQLAFDSPFRNENHTLTGAMTWITTQNRWEWMNLQSNKIPSVDIQDPAIDGQINWIGTGSGETRDLGGLVNINYKYKDKYLLQSTLRADAASVFGTNHRWGLFPGISLGWRFTSEPFMQPFKKYIDESMLRFSWGISGRKPTDAYARFASYVATGNGSYMIYPAIAPQSVQLDNLKWESQSSYDIGIEMNLFDYRVFIEGDIYQKLTTDLLFNPYNIPTSSGYGNFAFFNGGALENKGWEVMMDVKIIRGDFFKWSVSLNTSQNINSFVSLPDNFNTERSTSIGNGQFPLRVLEGEPIGSFFGFRYLGVYPTDADAMARDANGNLIRDNEGNPLPMSYLGTYIFRGGDAKYEDINHDGKIDLNDVVFIGDSNPDFIGGFGTNMSYRNFDLSCSFHYRLGFDIVNQVAIDTEGMNNRNNQSKAVLSRWRVQGQDEEGLLPKAYMYHPANNLGSDRYVEPGDYLRLINLKVGYRLRKDWCDRLNLRSVDLAFSARKILTITNYSGQDPEVGQDASNPFWIGVDRANTPPPKILTLSIAVGF